jgi:hypothetical protein
MTQITRLRSDDLEAFVERIPSGTSRISKTLRRAVRHSIQEIHPGTGTTSESLYQAARAIEGFYGDSLATSDFERDTQEDIRTEILPTLIEIHELLTWPDGWNGYSALAPKHNAVQYADHWIELFYQEVIESGQNWMKPNVTASAEGEVVLEWWHGDKGLTIYIGNQSAAYLKDWGADINTEMEDGYANSPDIRRALWKWLMN